MAKNPLRWGFGHHGVISLTTRGLSSLIWSYSPHDVSSSKTLHPHQLEGMAKTEFPIVLPHSPMEHTIELQDSLRESNEFEGHMAAPRQSLPSDFLPYQYFKLLMRKRTDCKCSPQRPQPSGKPSALVSPHCSTYVVIDQAPVPARHICAQTSVALIWPTVTDDQASGGWCRWWMNESAVCYFLSLSVFRRAVRRVIITPHLYSLSGGWEHSALIK